MLIISKEQMTAFSEDMLNRFENRVIDHINRFFPEQCEALDETQLREVIRYGTGRADDYDIVAERDVCRHIHLMFRFGRYYDTDPALPWAVAILKDHKLRDKPTEKIRRLWNEARKHSPEQKG